MNDFLQQFLIESRELVEQASYGLLKLEHTPTDAPELDAVFRAFHTLKGGAGIVEFAAMERAVHAAEDVLTEARAGKRVLTPAAIGACLACLDQVAQWLGVLEQRGELPSAEAVGEAEKIVHRFEIARGGTRAEVSDTHEAAKPDWVTAALDRSGRSGEASTAVRFVPEPECFFQGEDPIARMISLPQLLALAVEPVQAWPLLASLDPLTCNLALMALTAASVGHVRAHMQGASGECETVALAPEVAVTAGSELPPRVREVLEAQRALIANGKPETLAGRLASAGLTATNVLRFSGRLDQADAVAGATRTSLAQQVFQPLRDAINQALAAHTPLPLAAEETVRAATAAPRTLRVDAQRIDTLVRLTGELTVAKNSLHHLSKLARTDGNTLAGALKDCHGVFEHLVGELRRSVLAMRVLPLRSVIQRFPRVLREMSASLGKPARLQTEGEDTEADKAIVEMLFEPLLHVVRNALDHGVETPAERSARGKPPVATIRIRAARQGDQVHIDVCDDGGGIDVERVRRIARDRGVASDEELRSMPETGLINLVFAAGFSTAEKVTEFSGRGVG
ncbi:MAG TPA: Hpt domain-containing protein, partial [Steroidobacteraceae bacterium]|nr:Hpt domain-containing protein [Steroidobacteraceae bacterium]